MTAKQHYNMQLSRYKEAEQFMNRKDVSIAAKDKWVPELKKITDKLSNLLQIIEFYTEEEAWNGFAYEEMEEKQCQ